MWKNCNGRFMNFNAMLKNPESILHVCGLQDSCGEYGSLLFHFGTQSGLKLQRDFDSRSNEPCSFAFG